jgi:hypothetical protein
MKDKQDLGAPLEWSVAMAEDLDRRLQSHLDKGPLQEDLTFAYWRESRGAMRTTAVIHELALPRDGERVLHGNAAFTADYLQRVLTGCPKGSGIAFLHSHLGPGWQGMSSDDVVAERDRLAGAVMGRTGLPVVGLTLGTDGTWSGRAWIRESRNVYGRHDATTVRVVGPYMRLSFHPELRPIPIAQDAQVATVSVWGRRAQADLARARFGVVGVGNVGTIVAEALSRMGVQDIVLIDHDVIEQRNLDRTLGAESVDAELRTLKVHSAYRLIHRSHTASASEARSVPKSLLDDEGYRAALDCDILFSCVDRPLPRHVLNLIAYSHLIPVMDGGIIAKVTDDGSFLHADWRIHAVGLGRPCMVCIGALRRSDVALDRDGKLDDPDYIKGLPEAEKALLARRNVFPFGLAVAAHEVIQAVAIVTGTPRLGGIGPQHYACYPGEMTVEQHQTCEEECEFLAATATARDIVE